jgi:hypothetical protein
VRGQDDDGTKVPGMGRHDARNRSEGNAMDAAHDRRGWPAPPRNAVEAELRQALVEASRRAADEVALRRVWSRLSQIPDLVSAPREERSSFRRVRWPFVAGASLAGAAAAVAFMLLGSPQVFRARPTAPAAPAPVAAAAPTRGEPERSMLVAPATVRTASGETLQLSLRGGAEVTVTSDSTLVLDQDDQPTVSAGEVRFHVWPQRAGHSFVVRASGYRVVVVGTRFRVRVNGSNAAVGVDEGIVQVWKDTHRLARLSAGESWVSPPPETSAAAARAGEDAAARADEQAPAARGSVHAAAPSSSGRASAPVAELHTRSTRVSHGLRASLGAGAVSASVTTGPLTPVTPASVDRTLPFSVPVERPAGGAGAAASPARTSAPGATSAAPSPPPAIPAADAALASQARAARLAGESRRALALYRALAARGGTAGENAEYEVARVLRDGLHQPSDAIAAWRSYRVQHPRGLLRVEADISVVETLIAVDEKAAALSEAQDFVRRFPDGERRCEIGALAGDLLRERGDFGSALGEYDRALDSGRCRRDMTDAISFHRAMSLLHENRGDGVAALQGYLRSFPAGRFHGSAARLLEEQTGALAARRL